MQKKMQIINFRPCSITM